MQGWTKRPTFGDVVSQVQAYYKVTLPARTSLTFYDSFAMSQFREMAAPVRDGEEALHDHNDLHQAIQTATQEPGVTRADVASYVDQLGRQTTSAMAQVQQHLEENTVAQHRALQEQATHFAEQLARETQRADRRDAIMQEAMRSLQTPAPPLTPPPSQPQQVVHNYHNTHIQQLRNSEDVEQQRARDEQLTALVGSQRQTAGHIGETVRHLQQ